MNIRPTKHLLAAAAFAITGSVCAQEPEQAVKVNVDGLAPNVANQIREKAKQGPTELRLYLNRTRMIHQVDFGSIAQEQSPSAIARKDADAKMAARQDEARK